MKKDFKQELTELINKHGLEKEMRDKRPGIITGALPFRYRNERKPKLTP